MIFIFWIAIHAPWELAFPEDNLPTLNWIILAFFIFDIGINLRTTFYNEEFEEIVQYKEVAMYYIKSPYFYLDLVTAFPFDALGGAF